MLTIEKYNIELSVVIPIQNAGGNLRELIHRCLTTCSMLDRSFEIILVDDNSIDGSAAMIDQAAKKWNPKVKALLLHYDQGKNSAVFAGLAQSRGQRVIILEANLQNPPEDIPRLIRRMNKGADMVSTMRLGKHGNLPKWFFSSLVNFATRWAIGVKMHDLESLFMVCSRPVVEAILQSGKHSIFIPILAHSFSETIIEVPVRYNPPPKGYSNYSYRNLLHLLLDLPTAICALPLRVFTFMAILLTTCDLVFIACFLMAGSGSGVTWAAQHVTFLFTLLLMIIGGQFLGLGMFARYVSWFYRQSEEAPRFTARNNNFGIRNGQLINT